MTACVDSVAATLQESLPDQAGMAAVGHKPSPAKVSPKKPSPAKHRSPMKASPAKAWKNLPPSRLRSGSIKSPGKLSAVVPRLSRSCVWLCTSQRHIKARSTTNTELESTPDKKTTKRSASPTYWKSLGLDSARRCHAIHMCVLVICEACCVGCTGTSSRRSAAA